MRSEFITYASFTPEQRVSITLPPLDATECQIDTFWSATALIRGEHPGDQTMPVDGALRGDVPTSKTELAREVK